MVMKNIMIFDCLDTIQGYKGAVGSSREFYEKHLARRLGMDVEEMILKVPYGEQLYMVAIELMKGNLEPVILNGASELIGLVKEYNIKPVIVTADIPETARLTGKPFVDSRLIDQNDIHATYRIGPKKDISTWRRIRQLKFPDSRIEGIFEDNEQYALVASYAYNAPGFQVKDTGSGLVKPINNISVGSIADLTRELEKKLRGESFE